MKRSRATAQLADDDVQDAVHAQNLLNGAEYGHINVIRDIIAEGVDLGSSVGVHAAVHNQLECLKYITGQLKKIATKPYKDVELLKLRTTVGIDCLTHLIQHGAKVDNISATKAAELGFLSYLQYIHEHKKKANSLSLTAAVKNGHLACLAFIHETGKVPLKHEVAVHAAGQGHLDCLKYIFEHGCTPSIRISAAAAKGGHVECLKYAHQRGCPVTKTTIENTDSLDCIKYMHEQRVNWDYTMYDVALSRNDLDSLQYFNSEGLPCSQYSKTSLACRGEGECLRFLYTHGTPVTTKSVRENILRNRLLSCLMIAVEFGYQPTEEDCAVAAENNALACLQYLHGELHCPWDENTCIRAVKNECGATLRYALEHGCPHRDQLPAKAAAGHYSPDCLRVLLGRGFPCDATTCTKAVQYNRLENLKLLREHGCPWDHNTYLQAVQQKNTNFQGSTCLQYLLDNGCPTQAEQPSKG